MLEEVLPRDIFEALKYSGKINEIRIRIGKPITVSKDGQVFYLTSNGLSFWKEKAIYGTQEMIDDIIFKASEFSIYSVNEEIKQGFIVLKTGERIGICGSFVMENNKLQTITNFTSLNIRIPHEIQNCTEKVFEKLLDNGNLQNVLVLSSPGQGKTTFIRDFVFQLSKKDYFYDVLIVDERGEIAGKNFFNLGNFSDVLSFSSKQSGFLQGIRAMNPKLIVTDELGSEEDIKAIQYTSTCGVKVLATIHAKNIDELKSKSFFKSLESVFDKYVVLKPNSSPGQIEAVYDKNLKIFEGDKWNIYFLLL